PAAAAPRPAAPVGRGCRLPLIGRGAGGREAAGFVQLADSIEAVDPSAMLLAGGSRDPRTSTAAAPVLHGAAGATPSHDRVAARWVPAPPAAISPDGLHYAYAAGDGIHVVDLPAGADRALGGGGGLEVLAFAAAGVYAVHRRGAGEGTSGLLLLDPGSGVIRTLRPAEAGVEWAGVGGGAAWASATLPGGVEEVWRLDPDHGTVVPWMHREGAGLRLIAVDADGHPLVQVAAPQASSIWVATAPGRARQVSDSSPGGDDTPGYPAAVTDAGGVWVSDDGGILYRFSPSTGFHRVDVPRLFPTGQRVAGGCS
ncbi:MAG TPA: hypothetical protein VF112_01425, partial [Candidatus Dormibacteraeota bacterium]